jgi:hypothetical protein
MFFIFVFFRHNFLPVDSMIVSLTALILMNLAFNLFKRHNSPFSISVSFILLVLFFIIFSILFYEFLYFWYNHSVLLVNVNTLGIKSSVQSMTNYNRGPRLEYCPLYILFFKYIILFFSSLSKLTFSLVNSLGLLSHLPMNDTPHIISPVFVFTEVFGTNSIGELITPDTCIYINQC